MVCGSIFQAVGFFRGERCPTQAVLPLVGLAAEKIIRDRYNMPTGVLSRFPLRMQYTKAL
ncbi:MAG: hypothetical protein ACQESR_05600 [Planctomycetota bacterium]